MNDNNGENRGENNNPSSDGTRTASGGSTLPPPTPPRPADQGQPVQRRLYRDPNGPIAGVATGIARYFGIDPIIVQVIFVVSAFAGGFGLFVYVALWLLLPRVDSYGFLVRPEGWQTVAGAMVIAVMVFSGGFAIGMPGIGGLSIILIAIGILLLSQREGAANDLVAQARESFNGVTQRERSEPREFRPSPPATPMPGYQPTPNQAPVGSPGAYGWATPVVTPYSREPVPPAPPRPPITALTLALAVVATGVVLAFGLNGSVAPVAAWGMFALVCGAGLIVSAFTGRGAWLLLLPASIALVGMSFSAVDTHIDLPFSDYNWSVGTTGYSVTNQEDLSPTYAIGVGEMNLDLTEMTLTKDATIAVNVGVGDGTVRVPDDMNVVIHADVGVGDLTWFDNVTTASGATVDLTHIGDGASEGSPKLIINADIGTGTLTIENG